jgi:hypothetical protein
MVPDELMVAVSCVVVAVTDHRTPLAGMLVGVMTQMGAEVKATVNV